MTLRKTAQFGAAVAGYGVVVTLVERYQYDHGWSGKAFSLSASLGLLIVIASIILGWTVGRGWAVMAASIAVPEWLVLDAWTGGGGDTFPFEAAPVATHALYLGVFIALGVMTRRRDSIARRGAAGRPTPRT
jgi:hypothetical protein